MGRRTSAGCMLEASRVHFWTVVGKRRAQMSLHPAATPIGSPRPSATCTSGPHPPVSSRSSLTWGAHAGVQAGLDVYCIRYKVHRLMLSTWCHVAQVLDVLVACWVPMHVEEKEADSWTCRRRDGVGVSGAGSRSGR